MTTRKKINKAAHDFDFKSFLSADGQLIFEAIKKHCDELGISNDIDIFELSMLANSFDLYAKNASICKKIGATQKPSNGGWDQIRPEYTVMKTEFQNILKHSVKFALNPGDRRKIFNILNKTKTDEFDQH